MSELSFNSSIFFKGKKTHKKAKLLATCITFISISNTIPYRTSFSAVILSMGSCMLNLLNVIFKTFVDTKILLSLRKRLKISLNEMLCLVSWRVPIILEVMSLLTWVLDIAHQLLSPQLMHFLSAPVDKWTQGVYIRVIWPSRRSKLREQFVSPDRIRSKEKDTASTSGFLREFFFPPVLII